MKSVSGTARVWKPLGKTPLETVEAFRRGEVKAIRSHTSPKALLEKVYHGEYFHFPVAPLQKIWSLGSASRKGRIVEASTRLFSRRLLEMRVQNISQDVPIAYAGRLDPMAEGVLLLLLGDECKQIAKYRNLDKVYEVEVLLGASTDTGDLLGLVTKMLGREEVHALRKLWSAVARNVEKRGCEFFRFRSVCTSSSTSMLRTALKKFVGTHKWEYPVFSSKTVQGKPLFRWFYEGKLGEIEIPKRKMTVYSLQLTDVTTMSAQELLKRICQRIGKVTKVEDASKEWGNDFRREEVLAKWREMLGSKAHQQSMLPDVEHDGGKDFVLLKIRVACSSGTYMRTLAEKIGEELGVPACAFSITRTKIGTHYPLLGVI